ncbi:MAG: HNH endonuclease [Cocleimonas sp.]|nr:HNH endonuclease [Cocleimonas sp.]
MYDKCKDRIKVTIENKGNGHYQIKGKVLINHYPNSKNKTAYMGGSTSGIKQTSCCRAIQYALSPYTMKGIRKVKRKNNYKVQKGRLFKKNKKCSLCGVEFKNIGEATLDHKIPLSRGGLNHSNNYQLAHEKCNSEKGNNI